MSPTAEEIAGARSRLTEQSVEGSTRVVKEQELRKAIHRFARGGPWHQSEWPLGEHSWAWSP